MRFLELEPKKDNTDYIVRFMTFDKNNKPTRLWTTLNKIKNNTYMFDANIYKEDETKKEIYREYSNGRNNDMKFVVPTIYYNTEVTNFLVYSLMQDKLFKRELREVDIRIDEAVLNIKNVKEREENFKKIIKTAIDKEDFIAAIGENANYYVPLRALKVGQKLEKNLPGGNGYNKVLDYKLNFSEGLDFEVSILKFEEEVQNRLITASKNLYAVKLESAFDFFVMNNGREVSFLEINPFGWNLPQETIYYDENGFKETVERIAKRMILENYLDNDFIYNFKSEKEIIELVLTSNERIFLNKKNDFKLIKDSIKQSLFLNLPIVH